MTFNTDQFPPDVVKALADGNKIEAIKRLRQITGLGLAECKALVEARLRGQSVSLLREAHAKHPSDDTGGHVFTQPDHSADPRLHPAPPPNRSGLAPGEVKQSNAAAWVVALLVAVLVAYFFLRP